MASSYKTQNWTRQLSVKLPTWECCGCGPWEVVFLLVYGIHIDIGLWKTSSMSSLAGDLLFKEKYGNTSFARLYVKPPDQQCVLVWGGERMYSDLSAIIKRIFLPHSFPDSVSRDYIKYQLWDTLQAFCSTITGILATQEVLRGVGVGDTTATPLAATVVWVIKDGCGHIGKILFAYSHGNILDMYSKTWRMYADILNDVALCIEMALPILSDYTTLALCGSTVMKSIVGVAGSATRIAMTQHHALRGNIGDLSAKDSAQETAVNFVGSIVALLVITYMGSNLVFFMSMIALHIFFNYKAVRAVCLNTLNEPRFLVAIDNYLKDDILLKPDEINEIEPILFSLRRDSLTFSGFEIKIGKSLVYLNEYTTEISYFRLLKEIYSNKAYIVFPDTVKRVIHVFLKQNSVEEDVLCGYFHAVLLATVTYHINSNELVNVDNANLRSFMQLCNIVQQDESNRILSRKPGLTFAPSARLLGFVNDIAMREWWNFRLGLSGAGWQLNKHLLAVDEWRLQ